MKERVEEQTLVILHFSEKSILMTVVMTRKEQCGRKPNTFAVREGVMFFKRRRKGSYVILRNYYLRDMDNLSLLITGFAYYCSKDKGGTIRFTTEI